MFKWLKLPNWFKELVGIVPASSSEAWFKGDGAYVLEEPFDKYLERTRPLAKEFTEADYWGGAENIPCGNEPSKNAKILGVTDSWLEDCRTDIVNYFGDSFRIKVPSGHHPFLIKHFVGADLAQEQANLPATSLEPNIFAIDRFLDIRPDDLAPEDLDISQFRIKDKHWLTSVLYSTGNPLFKLDFVIDGYCEFDIHCGFGFYSRFDVSY